VSAVAEPPENLSTAHRRLATELAEQGKDPAECPNALTTMWTWITDDGRRPIAC
jgi:hypothetical protein